MAFVFGYEAHLNRYAQNPAQYPANMLIDLVRLQMDIVGARGELLASLMSRSWLDRVAPSAPAATAVLTLPGFLASDQSLLRLNRFLCGRGWQALVHWDPAETTAKLRALGLDLEVT